MDAPGKTIVVTGASRGIGRALTLALVRHGAHRVYALSRHTEQLRSLVAEAAAAAAPGTVVPVTADLSDPASVTSACASIRQQSPQVHVLVNNAGWLVNRPFAELTDEDWLRSYEVNVLGAVRMIRGLRGALLAADGGSHVVNIASMGGVQGSQKFSGLSAYSSGKGAVIVLTECLAEEFRDTAIRVNCLALGSVETEMFSEAFPGMAAALGADDAAGFIRWFSLEGRRYFNGKVLPVAAGTP